MAVAEALDIQSDFFPKIATGFCSGIARSGGQCGALSGAIMGLGLMTGRSKKGDDVDNNYARVRDLMVQFEQKFGALTCRELTGCDLDTPEGQEQFREINHIKNCLDYAEEATRLALHLGKK